jgi:hypothetical protein
LSELGGVKHAAPGRITPTRYADADFRHDISDVCGQERPAAGPEEVQKSCLPCLAVNNTEGKKSKKSTL